MAPLKIKMLPPIGSGDDDEGEPEPLPEPAPPGPEPTPIAAGQHPHQRKPAALYNEHDASKAEAGVNALFLAIQQFTAPNGQQVSIDVERLADGARSTGLLRLLVAKGLVSEAEAQTVMQQAMIDKLQTVLSALEADPRLSRPGKPARPQLVVPGRQ